MSRPSSSGVMSSRNLILILAISGFASTFSGSCGRAHGRGDRAGPEFHAADHRASRGCLRAALCLHPADPGAHRRCARQGAGDEGGAVCFCSWRSPARSSRPMRKCYSPCASSPAPRPVAPCRSPSLSSATGCRWHSGRWRSAAISWRSSSASSPVRPRGACRRNGSAGAGCSACPPSWSLCRACRDRHRLSWRASRRQVRSASALLRYRDILSNPRALFLLRLGLRRGASRFSASFLIWRRCSRNAAGAGRRRPGFAIGGFAIGGPHLFRSREVGCSDVSASAAFCIGGGFFAASPW